MKKKNQFELVFNCNLKCRIFTTPKSNILPNDYSLHTDIFNTYYISNIYYFTTFHQNTLKMIENKEHLKYCES